MRTAIRLAIVVGLFSVVNASLPGSIAAGAAVTTVPTRPSEADMVGIWTGSIVLDGTSEPLDGGIITIARADDRLAVSVGPNPRVRYACVRLARTDQGLRFEVSLPNHDETRLLAYDVAFANGVMTGTVTFVRHGLTVPALLTFTRQ